MKDARPNPSPWHDVGPQVDRECPHGSPANRSPQVAPRLVLGALRRVAVAAFGRGARNPTPRPPTRLSSLAVAVTVAVTMAASLLAPLAGRAHGGHPVGRALTVIQAVGPTEVAVTIEPPARAPGPLFVLIRPAIAPDAASLTLAAVPRGAESGPAPVVVRLAATSAGPYTAELGDIDNGEWELLLRAEGPTGSGEARIPFAVAPPRRSLAGTVREVAVGTLGVVLIAAVVAVGAAARRRRELPRWLPGSLGHGVVACLTVAALTGVSKVLRPPVDRLPATTSSRPHVNLLLRTEPARPEAGRPVALLLDLVDGATGRPVDRSTTWCPTTRRWSTPWSSARTAASSPTSTRRGSGRGASG